MDHTEMGGYGESWGRGTKNQTGIRPGEREGQRRTWDWDLVFYQVYFTPYDHQALMELFIMLRKPK